ncbi:centromere/kinetochore protein zw10 homolog [Aricia agestis]|uniref:centromere/kinetochore protein zw10 homolog n=1 Tax=Aricia agestis TaxID=91739 RepID=UPI001C208052|nr:centromere/kinetochore protein zw10 homolog [Aricia agestis]
MSDYDVDSVIQNIIDCTSATWTPLDKIPLVEKEIDKIKEDITKYVENSEFDIKSILQESGQLAAESKSLVNELNACKEEIEEKTITEILKSIENHDRIAKELDGVNFAINIVYDVLQCGKFVKDFTSESVTHTYTAAVDAVFDLLQYVETPAEGFDQLDLFPNTKKTAQLIYESLLHDLYREWHERVSITVAPEPAQSIITIKLNLDESTISTDIVNALDNIHKLEEKFSEFTKTLMQEVLIPIMEYECLVYAETDELATITFTYKENYRPSYHDVISNMRLLFHYLSNKFNIEYLNGKTLMKIFGKLLNEEFCDTIIEKCFIDTIPNTINELQTYGRITSEIEDFQHFLKILKFFPEEGLTILKYLDNIDVLFANRSSQYFLETARTIMLKDLSSTMSIGVEKIPEGPDLKTDLEVDKDVAEALDVFDKTIPKSLFYFPRCMISKTAQELLDLVYVVMEQAVQCSDIVCKKLYVTTRLIFELYDAVVPYHHENYLQTIPQYVALFHNNCMYLAHNLLTLGDKWLSLMEGRDLDYAIGFVDLVQKMRELGYKHLTMHMQQQRKQILDNIRSSDLNCIVVKDLLGDNAEAAVRQCLRQLQLLKNVWIGVFPNNVFTRLMATLTNMFIDELIHRVCTVEDISMEMATQLTEMYTIVVQKTPQLFQSPDDVEEYVKSWTKLRELIFVLGGSLKDIDNHWGDGTGPLAKHFTTEEVRSLIKALFQNTQFRANLLSKIK